MLSFFFSLAVIGVVALFFALKSPHKAPFLGARKTRTNVLLRYGGFCVVCLVLATVRWITLHSALLHLPNPLPRQRRPRRTNTKKTLPSAPAAN